MVRLRGFTRSTMVIAVLIAAQSTQAGAASPGNRTQDLGGPRAATSAGKRLAASQTAYQNWSGLSPTSDPAQSETSVFGDRGSAKVISALAKRHICQNVQATTGTSIPRQTGPSDLAYLERARALVKSNDIAAARLIFTRLANNGVAEAAFELGRTYDPEFLKTIPVAGLEPDREVAWQWYKRAAALGNADAKSRLAKLKIDTQQ